MPRETHLSPEGYFGTPSKALVEASAKIVRAAGYHVFPPGSIRTIDRIFIFRTEDEMDYYERHAAKFLADGLSPRVSVERDFDGNYRLRARVTVVDAEAAEREVLVADEKPR